MTKTRISATAEGFYGELTAHYHLLFADWDEALADQGRVLDRLIAELAGPGPKRILDAACGIGTQAIGLALQGHRVDGSDLSPQAVARATTEARRLGVELSARVADMRALPRVIEARYDIVTVLDNAFAHFLSQAELAAACAGLSAMLEPGGLFLASIRDYDGLIQSRPEVTPVRVFDGESERRLVFQVWDWAEDGASYDLTLYIIRHHADRLETLAFRTHSRALRRRDLTAALEAAGLQDVQWLGPEKSGFYQPVVAARRQR
jgi:SAM-dependent methyltransferase